MSRERMHILDTDGRYACIKACGKATEGRATTDETQVTCGNCLRRIGKSDIPSPRFATHKVEMVRGKEPMILVDGVEYRAKKVTTKKMDGQVHDDKVIFEVAKEDTKDKLEFIKDKLRPSIDVADVLEEILRPMTTAEVNKIYKILKDKKPKVTKQKGCLGLKIDGGKHNTSYIQIFE